jgi:hypothetical protein
VQEKRELEQQKRDEDAARKKAWSEEVDTFIAQRKEILVQKAEEQKVVVGDFAKELIEEEKAKVLEEYEAKVVKAAIRLERVQWAIQRHNLAEKRKALILLERDEPGKVWGSRPKLEFTAQPAEQQAIVEGPDLTAHKTMIEETERDTEELVPESQDSFFTEEPSTTSAISFKTAPDDVNASSESFPSNPINPKQPSNSSLNSNTSGIENAESLVKEEITKQAESEPPENATQNPTSITVDSDQMNELNDLITNPQNETSPKKTTGIEPRSVSFAARIQLEKALSLRCSLISQEALRVFLFDYKLHDAIIELGSKFLFQDGLFVTSIENIIHAIASSADATSFYRDRYIQPYQMDPLGDINGKFYPKYIQTVGDIN